MKSGLFVKVFNDGNRQWLFADQDSRAIKNGYKAWLGDLEELLSQQ
jgi:hypothetical protein